MLFTTDSAFDAEAAFQTLLARPGTPDAWRQAVGRSLSPLHTLLREVEDDDAVLVCVQDLVAQGMNAEDVRDEDNLTLLQVAAAQNRARLLPVLVASLRDPGNSLDRTGGTWEQSALLMAAMQGASRSVSALLGLGADVRVKDNLRMTALMHLVTKADQETVAQELLDAGVPLHAKDSNGNTALHLAARNGHAPVVAVLLNAGAKLDLVNKQGETPLVMATGNTAASDLLQQTAIEREARVLRRAMRGKDVPVVPVMDTPPRRRL